MIADLLVTKGPSSDAIADGIFYEPIYLRRPSPADMKSSPDVNRAPAVAYRVLRLIATPSSIPERSAHRLPVSSLSAASTRVLAAWPAGFFRVGGLCGFSPWSSSLFQSISEYLSRFLDWLTGQRFAAIQRNYPSEGIPCHLASTWKRIYVRGGNAVAPNELVVEKLFHWNIKQVLQKRNCFGASVR